MDINLDERVMNTRINNFHHFNNLYLRSSLWTDIMLIQFLSRTYINIECATDMLFLFRTGLSRDDDEWCIVPQTTFLLISLGMITGDLLKWLLVLQGLQLWCSLKLFEVLFFVWWRELSVTLVVHSLRLRYLPLLISWIIKYWARPQQGIVNAAAVDCAGDAALWCECCCSGCAGEVALIYSVAEGLEVVMRRALCPKCPEQLCTGLYRPH